MLDTRTLAVITAAVDAYIELENNDERRFGQKLSPWKMAGRRETMSKMALAVRANPARMSPRRFSII